MSRKIAQLCFALPVCITSITFADTAVVRVDGDAGVPSPAGQGNGWGLKGHGVDPDIEVIDDPAKMQKGGDPQLDAAIALMLEEIEKHPYVPAKRPANPDRRGMGVREEDK
jgi:hypothetical protein